MPTVAFDNKNGFWKSTYSYQTTCFSDVDDVMLSYREVIPSQTPRSGVFIHRDESPINTFFGEQQPSLIGVTFNDNVSSNKIYKTISIEGGNISEGTISIFTANSDSQNTKTASIGTVKDKGGILYADINGIAKNSQANVEVLGVVDYIEPTGDQYYNIKVSGADSSNVVTNSRFVFIDVGNQLVIQPQGGVTYDYPISQILESSTQSTDLRPKQSGDFYSSNGAIITQGLTTVSYIQIANMLQNTTLLLAHISPTSINGEQPKGQYSEALFTIPVSDFEIYAFNLNYEPTDLDHSK